MIAPRWGFPRSKNDCGKCKYVGIYEMSDPRTGVIVSYDLYYCDQCKDHPVVTKCNVKDEDDNLSAVIRPSVTDPALLTAIARSKEMGYNVVSLGTPCGVESNGDGIKMVVMSALGSILGSLAGGPDEPSEEPEAKAEAKAKAEADDEDEPTPEQVAESLGMISDSFETIRDKVYGLVTALSEKNQATVLGNCVLMPPDILAMTALTSKGMQLIVSSCARVGAALMLQMIMDNKADGKQASDVPPPA